MQSTPFAFLTLLLASLLLGLPSAQAHEGIAAPKMPSLSAKEKERLDEGKLVLRTVRDASNDGAAVVTGIIEIDAAPSAIWSILLDFESIPETSKAMRGATRYFDDKGSSKRIINMRYMLKVAWVEIVYHVHHDYFPSRDYLVWNLDPSKENGIDATEGSFSTWPGSSAGKTRFLYRTMVDTGRSIPDWVEEDLSESSLKSYIKYVKKQAEAR
ncbi:MAG: hypothetical protein VX498_14555 [Myxococcota bacterium]|nr:hypothetical protein [Myxococcota bacterium]